MKRWIISDTHFCHTNIIKYCNRPFKNVEEMNKELIKKWNNIVKKEDLVYHLGDFSMCCNLEQLKEFVSQLNGHIVLVMGNHDNRKPKDYVNCGFVQATRKPIIIDDNVMLMHEPPQIVSKDFMYLFGHVHDKISGSEKYSNCKCVCCDRFNYSPTNLDDLLREMRALVGTH